MCFFLLFISYILDVPCWITRPNLIGRNIFGYYGTGSDNGIFTNRNRLAYYGIATNICTSFDNYFPSGILLLFCFPEMSQQDTSCGDTSIVNFNVFGIIGIKNDSFSDKRCFV